MKVETYFQILLIPLSLRTHLSHTWQDMLRRGQSRNFSELSYWFCHSTRFQNYFGPNTIFTPYSVTKLGICVMSFSYYVCLCFLLYIFAFISISYLQIDFGLYGPYHVAYRTFHVLPHTFTEEHIRVCWNSGITVKRPYFAPYLISRGGQTRKSKISH